MNKKFIGMVNQAKLEENEFFPAPGGAGSANYQAGYGTFSSPSVSQNSANFVQDNKNKTVDSNSNTAKNSPDSGSMERDLNAIYSKKDTPTPDEVAVGLNYELGKQIKKDKTVAKQTVLANLRKDPHYYSELHMLGINDDKMEKNMNEQKQHPNDAPKKDKIVPNMTETKKIFEDLAGQKDKRFVVNSGIVDVMKQMWEQKQKRNSWRTN